MKTFEQIVQLKLLQKQVIFVNQLSWEDLNECALDFAKEVQEKQIENCIDRLTEYDGTWWVDTALETAKRVIE